MSKQNTTTPSAPRKNANRAASTPEVLQKALSGAGKETVLHQSPDGSRVLALPYGARILGLFPPESGPNFYWVNEALNAPASARELFAGKGWQNTGGDRTWLTPEIDIFFPDYPLCRKHTEPATLDAAPYALDERDGGVAMSRTMTLGFARARKSVKLRLSKWVGPALNPLRREGGAQELLTGVQYAGYTQRTHLKLLGDNARSPVAAGIWNLIQLPHGGELIVPTYWQTQPRVLFGDLPRGAIEAESRCVRFHMDLPGEHKIAIRAAASTGRIGYVCRCGSAWSLLVRNFSVNPSGEYVDVPKDEPTDFGYAIHAVNVLSALGDFCELEYHVPALGCEPGCVESTDVSQVWAFRGPLESIRKLGALLLGVSVSQPEKA